MLSQKLTQWNGVIKRSDGDALWFITADNTQAQSDTNIKRLMGLIIATAQQESFTQLTVTLLSFSLCVSRTHANLIILQN